jgi:Helix-turn-helix domain
MNALNESSKNLFEVLLDQICQIVREEITAAMNESGHPTRRDDDDGLVNVDKAAEYLSVSKAWLYKNSDRLPFAKKVGGARRFDRRGMRRWLENQRR